MDVRNGLSDGHEQGMVLEFAIKKRRYEIDGGSRSLTTVENDLHSVLMMVSQFLQAILNAIERFVVGRQNERVIRDPGGKFFVRRQPVRKRIG